jgi:hypothetical protein
MGGHLNAGFFAEYTGHLILAPKGNKLKQSCGIASNFLTSEHLHFNLLINVILSVATASCFPAFIRQKYQYDTM